MKFYILVSLLTFVKAWAENTTDCGYFPYGCNQCNSTIQTRPYKCAGVRGFNSPTSGLSKDQDYYSNFGTINAKLRQYDQYPCLVTNGLVTNGLVTNGQLATINATGFCLTDVPNDPIHSGNTNGLILNDFSGYNSTTFPLQALHKVWGDGGDEKGGDEKYNHGVNKHNVYISRKSETVTYNLSGVAKTVSKHILITEVHGNNYTSAGTNPNGFVEGVKKNGILSNGCPNWEESNVTDESHRVGGIAVTREQFGPGVYNVLAYVPKTENVNNDGRGYVYAIWTFHYEEMYKGAETPTPPVQYRNASIPCYNTGETDPGNSTCPQDGFSSINHEIDFEIPCNSPAFEWEKNMTWNSMNFNTWLNDIQNYEENSGAYYQQVSVTRDESFISSKPESSNEKDYIWYTMDWHVNNTHPDENYVAFYINDPFDPTGKAEVDGVKLPASPSAPSIHVTKKFIPTRFGRLNFGPWMAWWGHNKNRDDGAHFDTVKVRTAFISITNTGAGFNGFPQNYDQKGTVCDFRDLSNLSFVSRVCDRGKYSPGASASSCISCENGKYQDDWGSDMCKQCPTGFFQGTVGQLRCTMCAKGKYQNEQESSSCKSCASNHYSSAPGSSVNCTACNNGQFSNDDNSECIPQCQFQDGISVNNDVCYCNGSICEQEQFCTISNENDTKCHFQFCNDTDIDDFCEVRTLDNDISNVGVTVNGDSTLYDNGLKQGNNQCSTFQCIRNSLDVSKCCEPCPLDKIDSSGFCRSGCENVCNATHWGNNETDWHWVRPRFGNYALTYPNLRHNYPEYTNTCEDIDCTVSDVNTCCVEHPICTNLSTSGVKCGDNPLQKYNSTYTNNRCNSLICDFDDCCEINECVCPYGTPSGWVICPSNGTIHCRSCNRTTHWLNDSICVPLTTCNATQYQSIADYNTADRVCSNLTTCNATQYISTNHTYTTDRQCSDVTICNSTIQYESEAYSKYTNRECSPLTQCANDTYYRTGSAAGTCELKKICNTSQYQVSPGNITTDRMCGYITDHCNTNTWESLAPIPGVSNRVCLSPTNCVEKMVTNFTNITDRLCANWTVCTENEWQVSNVVKETNTDRNCSTHKICSVDEWEENPGNSANDTDCETLTLCNSSQRQYEVVSPNATRNRECAKCDDDSCIGCMTPSDCNYDRNALIHYEDTEISTPNVCSEKTCTRYDIKFDSDNRTYFNPSINTNNAILYGVNYRIDLFSNKTVTFSTGFGFYDGREPVNSSVTFSEYIYFRIPMDFTGKIKYSHGDTPERELPIKRDCYFDLIPVDRCTSECGSPGFLLQKRVNFIEPLHNGNPCPHSIWTSTSCVDNTHKCPLNCNFTESTHTGTCDAPCGKKGRKITKNVTVFNLPRFGGTLCPQNTYEPCYGPTPTGDCDCEGNKKDDCDVCGGKNACIGCDGNKYHTPEIPPTWNRCGECGEQLSDSCRVKLKLLAVKKEKKSKFHEKFIPTTFVVSFVFIFVFMFIYINRKTRTKKYEALPTTDSGIKDSGFYHKGNILSF